MRVSDEWYYETLPVISMHLFQINQFLTVS